MGKRKQQNREYWESELKFILSINKDQPGSHFNNDPWIFQNYIDMQSKFANEDGFQDISKQMVEHINGSHNIKINT